jgi:uncharacterized RDD family membrane protein YckC
METETTEPLEFASEPNCDYAGFWRRLAGNLVDGFLIIIWCVVYYVFISKALGVDLTRNFNLVVLPMSLVVLSVETWCLCRLGGTPGKLLMSLRVIDATSFEYVSTGQAVGRYFGRILSALPLYLGFLWVVVDAKKQTWHDKLANTVVVRIRR